jgi:hypothetical protein
MSKSKAADAAPQQVSNKENWAERIGKRFERHWRMAQSAQKIALALLG